MKMRIWQAILCTILCTLSMQSIGWAASGACTTVLTARDVAVTVAAGRTARSVNLMYAKIQHWQIEDYYINDMADVNTAGVVDTDLLGYDSATSTWKPVTYPSGSSKWDRTGTILSPHTANDTVEVITTAVGPAVDVETSAHNGIAIQGENSHADGGGAGVVGNSASNAGGAGVWGNSSAATGATKGVYGSVTSSDNAAYSLYALNRSYLGDWFDANLQGAAPANPPGSTWRAYFKSDGLYVVDSAGTTTGPLGAGGGVHNLLSSTHGDATTSACTTGDLIFGNGTPAWDDLAFPAAPVGEVLTAKGGNTTPTWEVPTVYAPTNATYITASTEAGLSAEQVFTAGAGISNATIGATFVVSTTNPWTLVAKSANETCQNDNTLNNDNTLSFAMDATSKYIIRGRIFFDTTAAGDFKYTFTAGTLTLIRGRRSHIIPGTTAPVDTFDSTIPSSLGIAVVGTGTTGGYIDFDYVVHSNGSGTWMFQWCQNTADNNPGTVVLAGSYLEWRKAN